MSDEYDKLPVERSHDGYWQALNPKLRLHAQLQWESHPPQIRMRMRLAALHFARHNPRQVVLAKICQGRQDDNVPMCVVWRLWVELQNVQ